MARAKRICPKPGCPHPATSRYCDTHNAEYETKRGTREQRGYGVEHKQMRASLTPYVEAGQASCAKCGQLILPHEAWDLGHNDTRTDYTGPEHATCNRADGGRRAHTVSQAPTT